MVNGTNFKLYGELPVFRPTRHCCGIIQNPAIYSILTILTVVQLIALLLVTIVPSLASDIPYGLKQTDRERMIIVVAVAIWLNIILISLAAFFRRMAWLHFPLMLVEFLASFFFMSSALVGVFVWSLTNRQTTTAEYQLAVRKGVSNALLALFHGYYTYVIFCLWDDTRRKRMTEEFIARQHMIDDVCEEMMWEEEEANKYAELSFHRNFPMSGIYQAEDGSLYTYSQSSDCSVSLCSAEITINTMYQAYQQDRRFVTFYDDNGHCGYY